MRGLGSLEHECTCGDVCCSFGKCVKKSDFWIIGAARGKITVIPFHCNKMLQCMLSYSLSALKVAHMSVSVPITGGLQIKTVCFHTWWISTGFFFCFFSKFCLFQTCSGRDCAQKWEPGSNMCAHVHWGDPWGFSFWLYQSKHLVGLVQMTVYSNCHPRC